MSLTSSAFLFRLHIGWIVVLGFMVQQKYSVLLPQGLHHKADSYAIEIRPRSSQKSLEEELQEN